MAGHGMARIHSGRVCAVRWPSNVSKDAKGSGLGKMIVCAMLCCAVMCSCGHAKVCQSVRGADRKVDGDRVRRQVPHLDLAGGVHEVRRALGVGNKLVIGAVKKAVRRR